MLSIIVAVANHNVIGGQNTLLWHLPADLKRFKEITSGHPVVMGRKTFESIGRPLPNRRNIVVTRQDDYHPEGVEVAHSLEEALQMAKGDPEVFVIGGGELFREALPMADRIYFTKVDADFEGDAFFPELGPEWREISREEGMMDDNNVYPHTFLVFERRPLLEKR